MVRFPCDGPSDDRPQVWDNPWVTEGTLDADFGALRRVVQRLGGRVVASDNERNLRAEFEEPGLAGPTMDDVEFFFTPDDVLVQFRAARRGGAADFGANRKRLERARIALGWEKVPVLRNRRRALVVAESPFDSFGPATSDREMNGYAMPAEKLYGDTDPYAPRWQPPQEGLFRWWVTESDDRVRSR